VLPPAKKAAINQLSFSKAVSPALLCAPVDEQLKSPEIT
jgi:hypothetical protein